ncbi:MAG: helix-turn-helix transcriptional regulator, partial [Clostridium sp.]
MYREFDFSKRLYELRICQGVSARDMSLSIGQNPSYINKIESGKAMPSMDVFFYICDFLSISPAEFFEEKKKFPQKIHQISNECTYLTGETLEHVLMLL